VRRAIKTMRATGANHVDDPLPLEVQPLVEELNALLAHTERQDLDEILGNLIENAAKYGGGSVFVTIDGDSDAPWCEIWIEDDGMGIPAAERSRIFDRGARLDTDKPGTGLGLAIVRDVVEIYGGTVELGESEDLGGLLVRLKLPRAIG
jgi:signal transduction histidine kinase